MEKGETMEACLKKSIDQYQTIIKHANQLDSLLLKSDPDELQNYTVKLQKMQDEAGLHDKLFMDLFSQDTVYWYAHPLFIERTNLLEKIVKLNHLLLPKIRAIMAVTANELTQIKGGRVAVAGYHRTPAQSNQYVRGIG